MSDEQSQILAGSYAHDKHDKVLNLASKKIITTPFSNM